MLGAGRAPRQLRTVILPRHNSRDVEDVPEDVWRELTFHFVDAVATGRQATDSGRRDTSRGGHCSRKEDVHGQQAVREREERARIDLDGPGRR